MLRYFYLRGCPYCVYADRAIEELKAEEPRFAAIEIERIEEEDRKDVADLYDYYYVPTFFEGKRKLFEAHPSNRYEDIKNALRAIFEECAKEA